MSVRVGVVVPGAGAGRRMGGVPKALMPIAGRPMLAWTLRPLLAERRVTAIAIALDPALAATPPDWLAGLDPRITIVAGGRERGDSVRAAIDALPADIDVIVVHDAARPLVTGELISRMIDHAAGGHSVVAATTVIDTVHEVDAEGRIVRTPERAGLRAAQTPQAFPAAVFREACRRAEREGIAATDDAALVAAAGEPVHVIEGERTNIKLTLASDVIAAEALLRSRE